MLSIILATVRSCGNSHTLALSQIFSLTSSCNCEIWPTLLQWCSKGTKMGMACIYHGPPVLLLREEGSGEADEALSGETHSLVGLSCHLTPMSTTEPPECGTVSVMRPRLSHVFKLLELLKWGLFFHMYCGLWFQKQLTHPLVWLWTFIPRLRPFTFPCSHQLTGKTELFLTQGKKCLSQPPKICKLITSALRPIWFLDNNGKQV